MLPFIPFLGAAVALTAGQKVAVKAGTKVLIATTTALGAASAYASIANANANKIANDSKQSMDNFDQVSKECDEKVANGEITDAEAVAIVLKAKDGIPSAEDITKLQKKARQKSTLAATGIAGIGAAASVGADILIDKYL